MRKFYILNGILNRFLICFFYLKRRNLSLDNRKRITTIYVTVWKLFTYTGLELSGSDHNRILIYEIWKKRRWVSLWDRGAQGTEYHQDGFLWHLYGFYDVTSCYLCNSTYISINIWNLEKKIWNLSDAYLQQEASRLGYICNGRTLGFLWHFVWFLWCYKMLFV